MTTLQEAAQNALEALERIGKDFVCRSAHHAKKDQHSAFAECPVVVRHTDAIKDLRSALAQHGEQQPVCHGCGIPAGDVHMSTCKSGKWPSRVSNGDTAAPAPQAQDWKKEPEYVPPLVKWAQEQPAQGEPVAWKVVTFNSKTTKSFLTKPEAMNYLMSNDADWDWYIEAALAAAPAPQAQPICKLFGTLPVYDTPAPQENAREE